MPAIGQVPYMAAMNMPAAQQIDIEFDERLQDIGGARHRVTRLELLGRHRQKAMVSAENAQFARLPFAKILRRLLHLARSNARSSIQLKGDDKIRARIELVCLYFFEQVHLSRQ